MIVGVTVKGQVTCKCLGKYYTCCLIPKPTIEEPLKLPNRDFQDIVARIKRKLNNRKISFSYLRSKSFKIYNTIATAKARLLKSIVGLNLGHERISIPVLHILLLSK